jgi:Raf kinase inhibitor-like YbhB/YbcL family protein
MAELAGTWTVRSFNPTYVVGDGTPERERVLIRAGDPQPLDLTLDAAVDIAGLEGKIEWQGGVGLVLNGRAEGSRFDIKGTGRPETPTAGWQYDYHGDQAEVWPGAVDQHYTLLGSVIRVTPHPRSFNNGQPAGEVFSFIAVRPGPGVPWGVHGSWNYRSFYNNPTPLYFPTAPQTAHLISQEAVFKLETPTGTTLQGTIEWPGGGVLDIRPLGPPDQMVVGDKFTFEGTGRAGKASGWQCDYTGHLTRNWPKPPDATRVDQRPALVGSVIIRGKPDGEAAPVGSVYPFIAVKQSPMTLKSTAFQPYDRIPKRYTCEGENVSPPLEWEGVPNGAKSLVLIVDDPDARDPKAPERVWVHWVVYNIPPDTRSLPVNVGQARLPQGALLGLNDFDDNTKKEYDGPCPPIGRHRYFHKLYALDIKLDLRDATKPQIERAMRGHELANTELIGTYQEGDK